MPARLIRALLLFGALLAVAGCGDDSSTDGPSSRCTSACASIEAACNSTTSDCAEDCQADLDLCPTEMQTLLDCVAASTIQCDAEQDQGLAEPPCEAEHAALGVCGADAF